MADEVVEQLKQMNRHQERVIKLLYEILLKMEKKNGKPDRT